MVFSDLNTSLSQCVWITDILLYYQQEEGFSFITATAYKEMWNYINVHILKRKKKGGRQGVGEEEEFAVHVYAIHYIYFQFIINTSFSFSND